MHSLNETGSMMNAIGMNTASKAPEIGDGVTILHWTDRTAATVVWVSKTGKTVHIQEDNAKRTDSNGMSECQTYEFTRNTDAVVMHARLTPKGWKIVKGNRILIGRRDAYYDYSF